MEPTSWKLSTLDHSRRILFEATVSQLDVASSPPSSQFTDLKFCVYHGELLALAKRGEVRIK